VERHTLRSRKKSIEATTGNAKLALPGLTAVNRPEYQERDAMPYELEVLVGELYEILDHVCGLGLEPRWRDAEGIGAL